LENNQIGGSLADSSAYMISAVQLDDTAHYGPQFSAGRAICPFPRNFYASAAFHSSQFT